MMGNVNQVGPDGSLTYTQSGTYDQVDPSSGQIYKIPTFTATSSLNPANQAIYDTNTRTKAGMSNIANERVGFLGEYLKGQQITPDDAMRSRYETALMDRMRPGQERDQEALNTRLANSGIGMGSRAYSAAQADQGRNVNDARLAAILAGGDEQARDFSVRSAARSAPINEISALLSGSQVASPNFAINRPAQAATTDYAGLVNQNYAQRQQNYQSQMAGFNNILGGLFGVGAAAVSDRRLKADIRKIGNRGGLNLYEYRYLWDAPGTVRRGYMAQEVAKVIPNAVLRFGEKWLALNYSLLPEVE